MRINSFPYLFIFIIILIFFPACSSGDDLTEEVFEIVEKEKPITNNPEQMDSVPNNPEPQDSFPIIPVLIDSIPNNPEQKDSIPNNPEQKDSIPNNPEQKDSDTNNSNTSDPNINNNSSTNEQTTPNTHYFKMEPYLPLTSNGGQEGAACYGDYLFHATTYKNLIIYNMKEKKHIAMISLETIGHADTMCFGTQKVEETDEFPVLYFSGSQSNTKGKGGDIFVYRLIHSIDNLGNETWQGILIQHIVTPDVAIIGSFPDVVIDTENKNMWIMGWLTSYGYDSETGGGCTNCFSKFNIPDIKDGKPNSKGVYQLTLTEEMRLSHFYVKDIHAITQGLCFYKGKIICPYGKPGVPYKGIDVVNVTQEYLTHNINLIEAKIYEAEAAVIYDNKLFLVGQRDYVFSCSGLDL